MFKYFVIGICLLLLVMPVASSMAQVHGNSIYGENGPDNATCITLGNDGRATIGGASSTLFFLVQNGLLIHESPTTQGTPQQAANFEIDGTVARFTGLSSNAFGFTQAVGVCRASGQTDDDGFFMNIGSSLVPQHTFFYKTPGQDRPAKVMTLSDGTFAVVGSVVTNNVSSSFVTRIGAPQPYSLLFHQVIGNPANSGMLVDQAVAVAELPTNQLLVAGHTGHFSSSAQGSLYLAKISPSSGTVKEFHTYTIGGGVLEPRATDMVVMADGSVVVVGRTKIPNDNDHFGFIMRVSADLNTATFEEVRQPGISTHGQSFSAVAALPGTDVFFVAGSVQRLQGTTLNQDALAMKVSNSTGPQVVRAINGAAGASDQFGDLILRDNNTTVQFVGSTTAVPSGATGLGNSNVLSSRMNLSLSNCLGSQVALSFDARPVTHATPSTISAASDPRVIGVMERTANNTEAAALCQNAKMMEVTIEETVQEATLFPNPARGTATLRFPATPTSTTVHLTDAMGRTVRTYTPSSEDLNLDLQGLSPGLYLVSINEAGHRITRKLIVR